MLELRTYTYQEMSDLFATRDTQGIKRRLTHYGIGYTVKGRGNSAQFSINSIADPLKVFCIIDLGFAPQTDFNKLLYFFYCLFNDEEFRGLPCETMECFLKAEGYSISRQTLQKYLDKLAKIDLINPYSAEYNYYFAHKNAQRKVNKEEYSAAWRRYWQLKSEGASSEEAIIDMCANYGGVARKQRIIGLNGIYKNTIDQINEMVCAKIEATMDKN